MCGNCTNACHDVQETSRSNHAAMGLHGRAPCAKLSAMEALANMYVGRRLRPSNVAASDLDQDQMHLNTIANKFAVANVLGALSPSHESVDNERIRDTALLCSSRT